VEYTCHEKLQGIPTFLLRIEIIHEGPSEKLPKQFQYCLKMILMVILIMTIYHFFLYGSIVVHILKIGSSSNDKEMLEIWYGLVHHSSPLTPAMLHHITPLCSQSPISCLTPGHQGHKENQG
jgi:hypothetical protein